VDEAALFAAIEEMRATERDAARMTRSARRDRVRRSAAPELPAALPPVTSAPTEAATAVIVSDMVEAVAPAPFDIIEQW
jgi:hypothetical protein